MTRWKIIKFSMTQNSKENNNSDNNIVSKLSYIVNTSTRSNTKRSDNTFSFCTQSSGSNLRIYKASNAAKCNAHLPRDNIEKTLSLYNSRQLVRADRCCLIDEVRFLAPLGVVSSNVPSSRLFVASPLSVSSRFRGLPRFLTLALGCAMPSVLSASSPPLWISIELLTPTCAIMRFVFAVYHVFEY